MTATELDFGQFKLNSETFELTRDGTAMTLGRQPFELLTLLIQNRQRVVERAEIVDRVWDGRVVSDSAISTSIKQLRQALGDDGRAQTIIRTIHGRGFRYVGPEPLSVISDPGHTAVDQQGTNKDQRPVVAVLAFTNLTGDADETYFSEGITQDIITDLSRFRELQVISPASSLTLESGTETGDAASRLGADYLVTGNIRRSNSVVRITAQLVDGASGTQLWAERYDRPLDDVFAIQEEIAGAVARTIALEIDQAIVSQVHLRPFSDLTAYDLFLRAHWEYWKGFDEDRVLSLLEDALARDPRCACALALKGLVYGYNAFARGLPADESTKIFRELALEALAIEDRDADLQAFAGIAHLFSGEHSRALHHTRLAMTLNPNAIRAIHYRGIVLGACGEPEKALELHAQAMRLDPFHPHDYHEPMLEAYYLLERYDEALAIYEDWPDPPAHLHLEAAACYALADFAAKAKAAKFRFEEARPQGFLIDRYIDAMIKMHAEQSDRDHWLKGLSKAGILRVRL